MSPGEESQGASTSESQPLAITNREYCFQNVSQTVDEHNVESNDTG